MNFELDESQKKAFHNITQLSCKINVLNGGPGRGKTTTIKTMLSAIWDSDHGGISPANSFLCAPTGKAAKVLDDALKQDIDFYGDVINKPSTIHRLLGCKGVYWDNNKDNRLACKLMVVDECSMVGSELMSRVITSVSEDCIFIFVGDGGQLPPISAGQPFHDIIKMSIPGTVNTLSINHRAAEGGMIAHATDYIQQARIPPFGIEGEYTLGGVREDDLFHEEVDDKEEIPKKVFDIVKKWHESGEDYQVLAPQHSGACGISAINNYLQSTINPRSYDKEEIKIYDYYIREGDKVINKKNNYSLGIFNGFTGTVVGIDKDSCRMIIDFYGELVTVEKMEDIKEIKLCYCMSIHASQGSEYKRGVLVIHSSHSYMLSRPLLYVGVSRFKEELHIIGDFKGLKHAVKNNKTTKRQTYLSDVNIGGE